MSTTIGDAFHNHHSLAERAAEWYDERDRAVPEAFRHLPRIVLRRAWQESGQNWRKCEVTDDDGLIIHNRPVW